MRRFLLACLICVGMLSVIVAADTPGEEAVKSAIKTLKEKRATVNDKGDQALLDTAIKDLEERLAQVGKGEPEPEAKKDEPFVMPKNWELKFNTGKVRPTYTPKTGELKLVYDFADAKQLKDFEFDKDFKPEIQRGTLSIKGGEKISHVVGFTTISVEAEISNNKQGTVFEVGLYSLSLVYHGQERADVFVVRQGKKELTYGVVGSGMLAKFCPLKGWYINSKLIGVKVNGKNESAARKDEAKTLGKLHLIAETGSNTYRKLTISGTLDPEWAKEFFADKK